MLSEKTPYQDVPFTQQQVLRTMLPLVKEHTPCLNPQSQGIRYLQTSITKEIVTLREELLNVQFDLSENKSFPAIIIIAGIDGSGKGETANLLNEWMDPRRVNTYAFGPPTERELKKQPMWRFWQALPPKGEIGLFFGSGIPHQLSASAMARLKRMHCIKH
jgi:polyphosphate kinase 2 (PPK2 family)